MADIPKELRTPPDMPQLHAKQTPAESGQEEAPAAPEKAPAESTAAVPAENAATAPAENTADTPAESTADAPAEQAADAPAEQAAAVPADAPAKASPKALFRKRTPLELLNLASIAFGCLLALALGMLLFNTLRSRQDQAAFRELAAKVEEAQAAPQAAQEKTGSEKPAAAPVKPPEPSPYWVLYDENPDFAAWLTIPDTVIDYPVMYTPNDPEHYIYRSFDGKSSPSGTPFVGAYGDLETQQCIIYGHNMKDGTMFNSLLNYADPEYLREHPTFTVTTLEEARTYEIFAAVETRVLTPSEPGLRFYRLEEGVTQWLVDNAAYDTGISATDKDRIMILSTCSYHTDQGRFIIAGRLAGKKTFAPRDLPE